MNFPFTHLKQFISSQEATFEIWDLRVGGEVCRLDHLLIFAVFLYFLNKRFISQVLGFST